MTVVEHEIVVMSYVSSSLLLREHLQAQEVLSGGKVT